MTTVYIIISLILISTALFFIYIFLAAPGKVSETKSLPFSRKLFAHRGLHNSSVPENSLAAFDSAAVSGFGIELDVRLTKDEKAVVFHDDNLFRMCGINKAVSDVTYAELQDLFIGGTTEKIPLFSDVLSVIGGRVPLIIELKAAASPDRISSASAALLDTYNGQYCIESFNPLAVAWFRKHKPAILRGLLCDNFAKYPDYKGRPLYYMLSRFLFNWIARPHFIAYNNQNSNSAAFRTIKKLFKPLTAGWTIKSADELEKCLNKYDIIIFEGFIPEKTIF